MIYRGGQKVVCITAHPEWVPWCKVPLVGSVYTVRGIDDTGGVLLEEIVNEFSHSGWDMATGRSAPGEPSFWPDRFRPIIERKTDISVFEKILDDASKKLVHTTYQ